MPVLGNTAEFDFKQFAGNGFFSINPEALIDTYWSAGRQLAEQITDVRELTLRELDKGRYIIGEFGQAYWLDKRHGFPPNVTASHTFTPEFFQSAGIPVQPVHNIGCCKTYDTKVGTHAFITRFEDDHPLGQRLKKMGIRSDHRTPTHGGWCDAVEKGDALRYGGFQDLVLNKLDALTQGDDWQGRLRICTAYTDPKGGTVYHVPRDDAYRPAHTPARL